MGWHSTGLNTKCFSPSATRRQTATCSAGRKNQIRDRARELAEPLGAQPSYEILNGLIGALLSTHSKGVLKTKAGLAIAQGTPIDMERIALFNTDSRIHFAFLESYFSNYVEGSRLIMNAELSRAGRCRIIIPTLFHPQFVDCLRALTQGGRTDPLMVAISRMANWCAQFDYAHLESVITAMRTACAFEESPAEFRLLNADGSRAT